MVSVSVEAECPEDLLTARISDRANCMVPMCCGSDINPEKTAWVVFSLLGLSLSTLTILGRRFVSANPWQT